MSDLPPLGTPGAMDAHARRAVSDRTRRIREQQGPPLTEEQIRAALEGWAESFGAHVAHAGWRQVGPCVYCSCGERLYQGRMPASKPSP